MADEGPADTAGSKFSRSSASTTSSRESASTGLTHPRTLEPAVLVLIIVLSVLGAIIGLHLVTTLGISANTSVIGALIAMLVGRVSLAGLRSMRSIHRQNLAQTAISASTFAAANALLTPIAVPFAFGRPDLVWPMLLGATVALAVDSFILYKIFDSRFMPASAAWPPGVAAAETIIAGDRGGRRAVILAAGGAVGLAGTFFFDLAMSAAGVALIGNMWALGMFGVGLMVNQYVPSLLDVDLGAAYIPHGVMIGAGIVALGQAIVLLSRHRARRAEATARSEPAATAAGGSAAGAGSTAGAGAAATAGGGEATAVGGAEMSADDPRMTPTVDEAQVRSALGLGYLLFIGGAVLLAAVGGLFSGMSGIGLVGWVLFAAFAALVHEVIVGLAAMHSGWFPAFAVTLIFLVVGLLVGIPGLPLALLVGYCAATGPAFADMGYDFKAGWMLRRDGPYPAFELAGRRQQYMAAVVGFGVALAAVALLWRSYLESGQIPPVAEVFADTVKAGLSDPEVGRNLLLWALPGALIQFIGGTRRQMGILLATGLLIVSPNACWLVFAALAARIGYRRHRGARADAELSLVGAGIIAGDSVAATGLALKD
ncbi:MAG: hypothetical protein ACRDTQ_14960 [Micromonosporaceae bacterium]